MCVNCLLSPWLAFCVVFLFLLPLSYLPAGLHIRAVIPCRLCCRFSQLVMSFNLCNVQMFFF